MKNKIPKIPTIEELKKLGWMVQEYVLTSTSSTWKPKIIIRSGWNN